MSRRKWDAAPEDPVERAKAAAAVLTEQLLASVKPLAQPAAEPDGLWEDVEINDCSPAQRYTLTKTAFHEEIKRETGAAVSTRGKFRMPGEASTERALHLHVQGPTREAVQRAVAMIRQHLPAVARPAQPTPAFGVGEELRLYVGLEERDVHDFQLINKLLGPRGAYMQHIQKTTGAKCILRGRGVGHGADEQRWANEPLHVYIASPSTELLHKARELAQNLIDTVKSQYAQWRAERAYPKQPSPAASPRAYASPAAPVPAAYGAYPAGYAGAAPAGAYPYYYPPAPAAVYVSPTAATAVPAAYVSPSAAAAVAPATTAATTTTASYTTPTSAAGTPNTGTAAAAQPPQQVQQLTPEQWAAMTLEQQQEYYARYYAQLYAAYAQYYGSAGAAAAAASTAAPTITAAAATPPQAPAAAAPATTTTTTTDSSAATTNATTEPSPPFTSATAQPPVAATAAPPTSTAPTATTTTPAQAGPTAPSTAAAATYVSPSFDAATPAPVAPPALPPSAVPPAAAAANGGAGQNRDALAAYEQFQSIFGEYFSDGSKRRAPEPTTDAKRARTDDDSSETPPARPPQ